MIALFVAAAMAAAPAATPGLSKEAEAALDEAARNYHEDPMTQRLRREAYDPANIRAARDVLDRWLFDYRSARIRDVSAYFVFAKNRRFNKDGSENAPILIYCGMINAPNRMGGMVGWEQEGWSPSGPADAFKCPRESDYTGLFQVKIDRIGPVGDEALARAFEPSADRR